MIELQNTNPKTIIWLVIFTFATGVALQYIGNYQFFQGAVINEFLKNDWGHRNFLFLGFPLFCIGALFNNFNVQEKISLNMIAAISTIGLTSLVVESYLNYINHPQAIGFDNLASLIVVAPAVFLFFKKLGIQGNSKLISSYATAVYFIHFFLLKIFDKFIELNGTMLTFVVIASSVFFSYFLIKLSKRLKYKL